MINYDNIPEELKRLKQWVCVAGNSKVPMQANLFYPASSTNPATWATFDEAVAAVRNGWYDYIGFVFNDNGIVGIDIDDGYTDDGYISQLASDIVRLCGSYTEKSKSGRGFHIFVKGDIPFKGKNNLAGVEIYKTARFFIMTGNAVADVKYIRWNQWALDKIVGKYFPETREPKKTSFTPRVYNPVWECPKGCKRVRIKPHYPTIPDGCRNICLTSLAGMMHSIGYSKGQIYRELQYANSTACKPPLDDGELRSICNSVTRYQR
jgi:hypothetical protein